MSLEAALAACTTGGLATRRDLVAHGCRSTDLSAAVRDGLVHRVGRGVYARQPLPPWPRFVLTDAGVAPAHVLRVRAVLLALGPGAAARRRTAAVLRGWALLVEAVRTVEVAVPHGSDRRRAAGLEVRQERGIEVEHVAVAGGAVVGVTAALPTALAFLLELPVLQSVVAVDSALRSGDLVLDELADAVAALPGTRGAAKARSALALCDDRSGSVLESVLRVRLRQAGITGFRTQAVLSARDGRRILRVDFCFPEARLVIETDGRRWHPEPAVDRASDNRLAAAGWRVLRMTWSQVVNEGRAAVALVEEALSPPSELIADEVVRPATFSAA